LFYLWYLKKNTINKIATIKVAIKKGEINMTKSELNKLKIELETLKNLEKQGITGLEEKIEEKERAIELGQNTGSYGIKLKKVQETETGGGLYDVYVTAEYEKGGKKDITIKKNVKKHYAYQIRNILSSFFAAFLESEIIVRPNFIEIMEDNVTKIQ
jgi:uncharacterized protein with GYD domain